MPLVTSVKAPKMSVKMLGPVHKREFIAIEQALVAEFEGGNHEQTHKREGHKWRGKFGAQGLGHPVYRCVSPCNFVSIAIVH